MDVILFKEDWNRFPSAIVDTKTNNESFLKLAHLYKTQLKIDNWAFCLTLLQPDLQGVDPFDENLSEETKLKIALECKYNPWYYFREIARLPPTSGNVPIQFKANRGIIAMYWCFMAGVDPFLLMPRQTGKSAGTDVLMIYFLFVYCENTPISLITKDNRLRNANIERLKGIRDLLPNYLHEHSRLDADNTEMITCTRLNNRYITSVARSDFQSADKLGRGLTMPILHFDEIAYISLIGVSLPVALAAGSAARDLAREQNQPYGNIYTTTAGDITTRDGLYAYEFAMGGATWNEAFFDSKNKRAFEVTVEQNSSGKKPLMYMAFNHRQLGRTDEWLRRTLSESNSYGTIADRDFFNIWTRGSEQSPLDESVKDRIKASEMEPLYTEITSEGFVLRWYVEKDEIINTLIGKPLIMGMDSSELFGEGNDGSAIVLLDPETHDVVMTGRFNTANVQTFSTFIGNFLIRNSNVLFVPERKSTGSSIIDIVILMLHRAGMDPFKRIFNRVVQEHTVLESEYRDICSTGMSLRQPTFYDRFKRYFGFATTGSGTYSRVSLYHDGLMSAMEFGARRIKDKTLALELLGLKIKNGRIDHSTGNHDDMVIALLLSHWICIKGQNLMYYGINPLQILNKAKNLDVTLSPVEMRRNLEQEQKRIEFDELMEKLKGETNPLVISKIEIRLRHLSKFVKDEELDGIGIDALLRNVKADKGRKARLNKYKNLY